MSEMTKDLEVQLGPDCTDLKMRFGMHSGPVTAGVLRGDRARFQLFGDTVNTGMYLNWTTEFHILFVFCSYSFFLCSYPFFLCYSISYGKYRGDR